MGLKPHASTQKSTSHQPAAVARERGTLTNRQPTMEAAASARIQPAASKSGGSSGLQAAEKD
jgi:hypothetical protein